MINLVSVGPSQSGTPDLRSAKSGSSDDQLSPTSTFAKALDDKISLKQEVRNRSDVRPKGDDPTHEKAEGEIKDIAPSLGISTKKTQLARGKVIQKFMDSFESEFGIPPTRLVEAMAQLNIKDQQKSPEETADQLFSSLQIDPEDQLKAKEMYVGFLLNLQAIEQIPRAPLAVPVDPANLMNAQMKEKFITIQGKKDVLRNSLETLNDKFWMKTPAVPISAPVGLETEIIPQQKAITIGDLLREQEALGNSKIDAQGNSLTEGLIVPGAALDAKSAEDLKNLALEIDPETLKNMSTSDLKNLVKELRTLQGQNARNEGLGINPNQAVPAAPLMAASQIQSQADVKAKSEFAAAEGIQGQVLSSNSGELIKSEPANLNIVADAVKAPKEFFPSNSSMMNSGQESFSQSKGSTKATELNTKKKPGASSDEITYGSVAGLGSSVPLKAETLGIHGETPIPVATPNEKQENVQQLMNQAQYLIKKGGGEMKIKLSPEGLGDMHLKVMVENGKVNLQMSTETAEAKKLVESSMSDLKSSLAGHRLSVENVKIDVVNSTSSDVATKNDSNNLNSQGQFQGKETRQFWNQFQEQFGSRGHRESFFDVQSIKGYGQKKRDPLTPLTEAQRSRRADGRGNAIDVVA